VRRTNVREYIDLKSAGVVISAETMAGLRAGSASAIEGTAMAIYDAGQAISKAGATEEQLRAALALTRASLLLVKAARFAKANGRL